MRTVMLLSVACILLLGTGCKFFKEHRLFGNDVDSLVDLSEEENDEDSEDEKVEIVKSLDQEVTEEEPETIVEIETPSTPSYVSDGKYFMIVGSFRNEHFAERYAEKIQQMGYQTQIIESPNGFYRVSAKSFSTLNEGINELEEFRMNVVARAWVHIKY